MNTRNHALAFLLPLLIAGKINYFSGFGKKI